MKATLYEALQLPVMTVITHTHTYKHEHIFTFTHTFTFPSALIMAALALGYRLTLLGRMRLTFL